MRIMRLLHLLLTHVSLSASLRVPWLQSGQRRPHHAPQVMVARGEGAGDGGAQRVGDLVADHLQHVVAQPQQRARRRRRQP